MTPTEGVHKTRNTVLFSVLLIAPIFTYAQEIFDAIRAHDLESVRALIETDKDVVHVKTEYGDTPLHVAALVDNDEIAELLIGHGADTEVQNGSFYTPLMRAGFKATKVLVEKGADIDFVSPNGQATALSRALMWKEKDVAEYLLDCGAKIPEEGNRRFRINLISALKKGIISYLETCLKDGLDPLDSGESRSSFFHFAAQGNSTELLDKLFQLGIPIDRADIFGWTPLHHAAYFGNRVTAEWFMKKGADSDARTTDGKTPYNLALEAKNTDVAHFLIAMDADQSPPQFPELYGDYLGQKKPGREPVPFAPGLIASIHRFHSTIAFSRDGGEAYWGCPDILCSMRKNGTWTVPDTSSFLGKGDAPFFSPDGKRFYFVAQVGERMWEREAIGFMEKRSNGWSEFELLPDIINSTPGIHFAMSVDLDGNCYFGARQEGTVVSRIYVSEYRNGTYSEPVILEQLKDINAISPYIAPDGKYLIFTAWDSGGLTVSFRKKDGGWTDGRLVTESYASPDRCPIVSHDGRFLFFLRFIDDRYIPFWVDAEIIEELQPDEWK